MDLLLEPSSPVSPTRKTPYVCEELWDGGPFRTYPVRKGKIGLVPVHLRGLLGVDVPDAPYLETLYPSPKEEVQPFLQTWLWFGLLSEMLSLNEIAPNVRFIREDVAIEEIRSLHETSLVVNEDGSRWLSANTSLDLGERTRERTQLFPDRQERMVYMRDCLQFANAMLLSVSNLEDSIRYSLGALGELFSTGLFQAVARSNPKIDVPVIGFSWHQNYVKSGGAVESQMLQNGWCVSETEKIRSQFQGLQTMHYIGQLKRPTLGQDHSKCTKHLCTAFQMNIESYRPSHATVTCNCSHIGIDETTATSILRYTDSYPIIKIDLKAGSSDDFQLITEAYEPGVPYVALSHVWANGLGNPRETSLPRCQIKRVAQLIASLQRLVQADNFNNELPYRVWIDTLCCPIKLESKMIALQKIADVYRNATHVLVLDASLTKFDSEDTHPAELLLRIYGSSPWMRRLWTLQEGALTSSLYIQFADKAVNSYALLTQLFIAGNADVRYTRIWQDIMTSYNELQGFFASLNSPQLYPLKVMPQLVNLQRALNFRTVSVPSDEPLCISTLMSLDTKYIAEAPDVESRMARLWELLARSMGTLPARLIFYQDKSLTVPGWRWAPRSLLASSISDPVMGIDERSMRFSGEADQQGTPTSLGLKVAFAGCRLIPVPRVSGFPLHPWPGIINPTEDQILLLHEETGKWYRLIDWYRSRKLAVWTREERLAYDSEVENPLCKDIDTGRCALIYDKVVGSETACACCVVLVEEGKHEYLDDDCITKAEFDTALIVRRTRTVILSPLNEEETRMMATVQNLANIIALDPSTSALLGTEDHDSEDWKVRLASVKQRIQEVIAEAWKSDPSLAQTVKNTIGIDLEEYMWVLIPKLFSHDTIMKELPSTQLWFVD